VGLYVLFESPSMKRVSRKTEWRLTMRRLTWIMLYFYINLLLIPSWWCIIVSIIIYRCLYAL